MHLKTFYQMYMLLINLRWLLILKVWCFNEHVRCNLMIYFNEHLYGLLNTPLKVLSSKFQVEELHIVIEKSILH